ncbi:MAG: rhodanese-like domain-containing protein [Candidatus Binatia bacterium]|nr:rhodanese-like domain-containing protein [Candidatus Binatia bacterium]
MKRFYMPVFTLALAAALLLCGNALADDHIADVTPDQLESMMNAGNAIAIDANGATTRTKHGTVPDAVLLSDYKRYQPTAELPSEKDTQLVFYCANTHCGAAPAAAQKAQAAGFENVAVMSEGIMGWAKSGKTVSKDKAS